jgi:peptide-methionine (S)-S-oxide reductase
VAALSYSSGAEEIPAGVEKATFAGGCFWCVEETFEKVEGVVSATSGYIGGSKVNPSYEEVSAGVTGHTESVEIVYDPATISYEKLLEVFWHNIDPTTSDRQFCEIRFATRSTNTIAGVRSGLKNFGDLKLRAGV